MSLASPLLGCIADDFTGATDLANTLVRQGMRTVQCIGIPGAELSQSIDADALIIALKSRTAPVREAVRESLAALRWLQAQGCEQFMFKYCSTFDSTETGNIGPVIEALLDALGSDFTVACPAFPETGRTVFRGHLFVQDNLLSESGMEHHPLTPMTDSNLVRFLGRQTPLPVGLIRYDQIAEGEAIVRARIDTLRQSGTRIAIADALSNTDLLTLGSALNDLALITGGSGIALGLPENFRRAGKLTKKDATELEPLAGRGVVLAGSVSKATNGQVAAWIDANRPAYRIDPLALARGEPVVASALAFAEREEPVLIYATSSPDDVRQVQQALGTEQASAMVERALGEIARHLFDAGVQHFVIAGGETSGAVVQALGIQALRIGAQIDPGVPVTSAIGLQARLALKSGNFGSVDFFAKALNQLTGAV